jgi:predicted GIY-YIG superfamily endonuclease
MFYVYLLYCYDTEEWYTGYTSKVPEERLREHNRASNRSWTRGREWSLMYYEAYPEMGMAKKREWDLKHDGRSKKRIIQRLLRLEEETVA